MFKGDIGVYITSFDRPHYLRQLIASLESQTWLYDTYFHFFQDGAVNKFSGVEKAKQSAIDECVTLWHNAHLPHKYELVREHNVGIAIQHFDAIEYVSQRFEYVILLEDDVVLSPHFLRLARILIQEMACIGRAFSVSPGFKKMPVTYGLHPFDARWIDTVIRASVHWWAEIIPSRNWAKARPYFMEYYDLVREMDYSESQHRSDMVEKQIALWRKYDWKETVHGQDNAKGMAVHALGMRRWTLPINRAISIGKHGEHFTPDGFKRHELDNQKPYVFDVDAERENFEWHWKI